MFREFGLYKNKVLLFSLVKWYIFRGEGIVFLGLNKVYNILLFVNIEKFFLNIIFVNGIFLINIVLCFFVINLFIVICVVFYGIYELFESVVM